MAKYILFFSFSLIGLTFSNSLKGQLAKYSNEFLKLGIGANSFGVGGAVTATTSDVTAGYWNPAGLRFIKKKYDVALMHSEYFAGIIKYDYIAGAYTIDEKSTLGVSFIRLGVDGIPNTTALISNGGVVDYSKVTSFSVADNALLFSYARELELKRFQRKKNTPLYDPDKRLTFGGNLKIIYRNIGEFASAWGFGFDLGIQYRSKGWLLGAALKDVTSTFNAWNITLSDQVVDVFKQTNNDIPTNGLEITLPTANIGIAKRIKINKHFGLLPSLDLETTFDGLRNTIIKTNLISINPKIGLEANYNKLLFLRLGLSEFQQTTTIFQATETSFQLSLGLGIRFKYFDLSYAFTDLGDNAVGLYSNVFSLRIMFDKL